MTVARMQAGQAKLDATQVGPSDLTKLGHIFKLNSVKPEYSMNSQAIPDPILQMAYLKLFISLSLLMTTVLDRIQFNDGLKYHKILFGNRVGKHSLDTSLFPDELSVSESEFWQAYRNWLPVVNIIVEPAIADGWKQHHAKMMSNRNFSTWFGAWWEHDRLL